MSWLRPIVVLPAFLFAMAFFALGQAKGDSRDADKSDRVPDKDLATWIEKRLKEWEPTAQDRRFDEIGWVKDIREAERLGQGAPSPGLSFHP